MQVRSVSPLIDASEYHLTAVNLYISLHCRPTHCISYCIVFNEYWIWLWRVNVRRTDACGRIDHFWVCINPILALTNYNNYQQFVYLFSIGNAVKDNYRNTDKFSESNILGVHTTYGSMKVGCLCSGQIGLVTIPRWTFPPMTAAAARYWATPPMTICSSSSSLHLIRKIISLVLFSRQML